MPWLKGQEIGGYVEVNKKVRFMQPIDVARGLGFQPTRSRIYYVDGVNGNDNYDGTAMSKAFQTITQAYTTMRARIDWSTTPWSKFDMVVVAPGVYAENITALPHGCITYGLGWDIRDGQSGVKIKPASGSPVASSGFVNGAFFNVGFESVDANEPFDCGVLNNCYFENCLFTGPAEDGTTTAAAFKTNDCVKTTFRNSWFCNAVLGVNFAYADGGDSISYLLMEDCIVSGVTSVGIQTSTNLVGPHSLIRRTDIYGGGQTLATGVNDLSHILQLSGVNIEATTAIGASGACRGVNFSYGNGTLLT